MLRYSHNNISIVLNVIMFELLSTRFVHIGALQLSILSFLTPVRL